MKVESGFNGRIGPLERLDDENFRSAPICDADGLCSLRLA